MILHHAGVGTPALALTCKALSSMWEGDTTFQAWWLLRHSSSILVTTNTGPKLQMLFDIAELVYNTSAPLEMLRLQWALQAESGKGRYGDCEGQHQGGAVTCFGRCRPPNAMHHLHKSTSCSGQRTRDAQAVSSSRRQDVGSLRAPTHVSASASELRSAVHTKFAFCVQGEDAHSGLLENGGVFRDACWNGRVCYVRLLLLER